MTSKLTITRERLEQLADNNTICKVSWDERIELAQIALAAMDSEPFAYIIQDKYERERGVEGHLSRGHVSKYVSQEDINEHEITCTPLYRHAQPAQTGVDDDVRNIIGLLETNEWAEHCTETVLGSRLEAEITRLIGCAQPAPVVPDDVRQALSKMDDEIIAELDVEENACRAAMLNGGKS